MAPGYDTNRFVDNPQSLAVEVMCAVCLDVLEDPVETECQHHFCRKCLEERLTHLAECPTCRAEIHELQLRSPNRTMKQFLGSLMIRCCNSSKGCGVVVPLDQLSSHETNGCAFLIKNCVFPSCGFHARRGDANAWDHHNIRDAGKHATFLLSIISDLHKRNEELSGKIEEVQTRVRDLETSHQEGTTRQQQEMEEMRRQLQEEKEEMRRQHEEERRQRDQTKRHMEETNKHIEAMRRQMEELGREIKEMKKGIKQPEQTAPQPQKTRPKKQTKGEIFFNPLEAQRKTKQQTNNQEQRVMHFHSLTFFVLFVFCLLCRCHQCECFCTQSNSRNEQRGYKD